jgi:hypothetical protein
MDPIILQNNTLRLEFSPQTGALTGLTATQTGWNILDRPQLGLSFRLLVPLAEDLRNNPVYGEKQALTAHEVSADGRLASFIWEGVTSERGGKLDIRVALEVRLDDDRAVFSVTVQNRSQYVVENVYCPYLGDVQHPAGEEWFKTFIYTYATANEWRLWPQYDNLRGYYGVDYPTQFHPGAPFSGTPMSPFFLLRGQKQGLYAGAASSSTEYVAWHTELRPGYGSSIDARVPEVLNVSGKDVATRFAAVHVPYLQPGETRALTPIAIEPYQGGWQQGCDIYLVPPPADPRLGKGAPRLATDPHQLAGRRAARALHRPARHWRGMRQARGKGHPAGGLERRRAGPGQPLAQP